MNKNSTVFAISAFAMSTFCSAQSFTGASGSDQNFSTAGNWEGEVVPATDADISIAANGTSSLAPAVVDGAWDLGVVRVNSLNNATGGFGTGYAEIVASGALTSSQLYVGSTSNGAYDGNLTIRSGGSIASGAQNSGIFSIGGETDGLVGEVLIENGASVEHSRITLAAYGVMTFEFGANSVSTFNTIKNNADSSNVLNGLLQVDLAALTTVGSYTLINSDNTELLLSGQLVDDLATAGGTITSSGQSSSFNVLNEGSFGWNLTTTEGGQDLVFNVTSIPEPSMYAGLLGLGSMLLVIARRNRR